MSYLNPVHRSKVISITYKLQFTQKINDKLKKKCFDVEKIGNPEMKLRIKISPVAVKRGNR